MANLPTYSPTSICQKALLEVPDRTIADIGEQTLQGITCAQVYGDCVGEVLEEHPWEFAITRQTLAAVPNDRIGEWCSAFAMPQDAAFVGKVFLPQDQDGNDPLGFIPIVPQPYNYLGVPTLPQIQQVGFNRDWNERAPGWRFLPVDGVLYSDAPFGAVAEYTTNQLPESSFRPLFVRALVMLIASRIAPTLRKDRALQKDLFASYQFELGRAKKSNMERTERVYGAFISDWISVR